MLPAIPVDDPRDPRLADFVGLTDAELRRRHEHDSGVFIAEGSLVIRHVASVGATIRAVLVTENRLEALHDVVEATPAPVYVATRELMREVAGFDLHRGAVASVDRPPSVEAASLLSAARRVLVVEDVNDTENMGVLFRNAAGLGVDAVLRSPRCCDPFYRRTVRVSMGHVLSVPSAVLAPWPDALDTVRAAGFTVAALAPRGATPIDDAALTAVECLALLVGAEGSGLTAGALAFADVTVAIPMDRGVDSLNVASAAAIALHAARPRARQEPEASEATALDT